MHINPASFSVCDARDKLGNVFCPVCRMQRADAVEDWRAGKRGSVQRDEALRAASSGADRSNPRLESVEQRAVSTGAWARHSGPVQRVHGASARAPTQGAAGSYADETRPYKAGHGQQRGNSTGAAADWGVDARLAALLPVPPRGNVAISAAAPSVATNAIHRPKTQHYMEREEQRGVSDAERQRTEKYHIGPPIRRGLGNLSFIGNRVQIVLGMVQKAEPRKLITCFRSPCERVWAWKPDSCGEASVPPVLSSCDAGPAAATSVDGLCVAMQEGARLDSATAGADPEPSWSASPSERLLLSTWNSGMNVLSVNGEARSFGFGVGYEDAYLRQPAVGGPFDPEEHFNFDVACFNISLPAAAGPFSGADQPQPVGSCFIEARSCKVHIPSQPRDRDLRGR